MLIARRSSVLTGIAMASCGYALFALQDATVKWLVVTYPVPEILFIRSAVILGLAVAVGRGTRVMRDVVRSNNKGVLATRGVLILLAWLLFYSAAAHLGLAEITTLYFAAPIIAVVLSTLVLKETVGVARWAAVGLGFAGVATAAGPLGALAPGPAVAALAAAACWGTGTILIRWSGRTDSTLAQMVSSNAIFLLGSLAIQPWAWRMPEATALALMVGIGFTGGMGQYLLFEGFRHAPASALAPIEYTGLVWATVYGYAIWADVPGPSTIAGGTLIAAGSLALVWVEGRRSRRATA